MKSEYLVFEAGPRNPKAKTEVWLVRSKRRGALLGTIKWYGAWRQYCFWPSPETVFNRGCLSDINAFIEEQKEKRRQKGEQK